MFASVPVHDDLPTRSRKRHRFRLRDNRLTGRGREALPGLDPHRPLSAAPRPDDVPCHEEGAGPHPRRPQLAHAAWRPAPGAHDRPSSCPRCRRRRSGGAEQAPSALEARGWWPRPHPGSRQRPTASEPGSERRRDRRRRRLPFARRFPPTWPAPPESPDQRCGGSGAPVRASLAPRQSRAARRSTRLAAAHPPTGSPSVPVRAA